MNIQKYYKILGLPLTATKEEIENRYKTLSERYHPDATIEELKALAEVTQSYRAILKYLEDRETLRREKKAQYILQRKRIVGKLQNAIRIGGMKAFTATAVATGILISTSAFVDVSALTIETLKNLQGPTSSNEMQSEMPDASSIAPIFDEVVTTSEMPEYISPTTLPSELPAPTEPIAIDSPAPTETPNINEYTENGHIIENVDGVTYVDGYMIANKTYSLPRDYTPKDTKVPVTAENGPEFLDGQTLDAFRAMQADASSLGLNLWIASGYRSYDYQERLYDKYVRTDGSLAADTYSSRPGHSEHQTGYAFDLNSVTRAFANTREGIWINENCYKYGFIIRYPLGKEAETGYIYEPWHLRYVGPELATQLYNGGDWITMEKHFGITSNYDFAESLDKPHTK